MANKTVFSRPDAKESHSRNSFDRSFVVNFDFSGGMALPTFCKFVFGKSHARINQRSFMRTADVLTAAFPSLPMYTDYFFVPMHQILSSWNDFRSRTNDRFSSRLGNVSRLPSFNVIQLRSLFGSLAGSSLGDYQINNAFRLLDMLDYGFNHSQLQSPYTNFTSSSFNDMPAFGDMTPLALCAYQKVYYDHYRNTSYEANDVEAYNIDDLYTLSNGNETVGTISNTRLEKFLRLHYVNYRRDSFNTVYPSLNFVASSANGLQSLNSIPNSVVNLALGYSAQQQFAPGTPAFDGMVVNVNGNSQASNAIPYGNVFSTSNIRAAFALEKLLRVSAFAPQHVVDQFEARFGYRPKSASMRESVRLGSFKNDIIIGEVTATANSQDAGGGFAPLGTIGGKGVGAGDYEKPISYDVPEDGFIIGISYVLPINTYDSSKINPIHQQFVAEDWSLPEYENLGMQPLFMKNLYHFRINGSDTDAAMLARANLIVGYQPRDMQYKASVSTNHGLFNYGESLDPWVLHGRLGLLESMSRSGTPVDASYFKCSPSDLDSIFALSYDGTPLSDQFFGSMVVQFGCIQDKPIFGIPKL